MVRIPSRLVRFSSKCVFLYGCTTGASSHADSAVIWSVLEVADSSLWVKAEALNLRSNLESVLSQAFHSPLEALNVFALRFFLFFSLKRLPQFHFLLLGLKSLCMSFLYGQP